jgi:hypothetical protein
VSFPDQLRNLQTEATRRKVFISYYHGHRDAAQRFVNTFGSTGGMFIPKALGLDYYGADRINGSRAVAESVKTSAWRYAMAAEPFIASLPPADVDLLFVKTLKEIMQDQQSLSFSSNANTDTQPQITDQMRDLRSQTWKERIVIYLRDRVNDQRGWYTKKARASETSESQAFLLILGTQLLSIIALGAFAVWSNLRINIATVFTATTAALLAWLQVKRYQETSQSYAVTAHELGFIAEAGKYIQSEDNFSKFVADAENAMSREHTLWAARRQSR